MWKIWYSEALAVLGIILSIIVFVMDKMNKGKGPMIVILLIFAALLMIPMAIGNPWVSNAPTSVLKIARSVFLIFLIGTAWSLFAVYLYGETINNSFWEIQSSEGLKHKNEFPNDLDLRVEISSSDEDQIYYDLPLRSYKMGIENIKITSISNCYIEFVFNHVIADIQVNWLFPNNGMPQNFTRILRKDGKIISRYQERLSENPITKNCSLNIVKATINEETINTNRAVFACEKWPDIPNVKLSAIIAVDLSKKGILQSKPSYYGKYFYEIDGHKESKVVQGDIPIIKQ